MSAPRLLHSVASTTEHRDRDDLDAAVARLVLSATAARAATIFQLIDEGGVRCIERRVTVMSDGRVLGPARAVGRQRPVPVESLASLRRCLISLRPAYRRRRHSGTCLATFPFANEREVIGLLQVASAAPLTSRDSELVDGLLRIVRNHLALLDYGERDTLTGLRNRKTFESSFGKLRLQAMQRSRDPQSSAPSWLAVIDIDRFKAVNDAWGHLFGDEVLLLVSQLLRNGCRSADQLFRFGGEEFVVVLDRASAEDARTVFERLRASVEARRFPQVGQVSISLGYTCIDENDAPSSSIERADAALYYAKNNGRNRIESYEDLLARSEIEAKGVHAEVELF